MSRAPAPNRTRRRNSEAYGSAISGISAPRCTSRTLATEPKEGLPEEIAQLAHEALLLRQEVLAQLSRQLFDQLPLPRCELRRHLDGDLDALLASTEPTLVRDPFSFDAQHRPGLRAGRDPKLAAPVERRHVDVAPECRVGESDRHRAHHVVADALEERGWAKGDRGLEITAGGAGARGLPPRVAGVEKRPAPRPPRAPEGLGSRRAGDRSWFCRVPGRL